MEKEARTALVVHRGAYGRLVEDRRLAVGGALYCPHSADSGRRSGPRARRSGGVNDAEKFLYGGLEHFLVESRRMQQHERDRVRSARGRVWMGVAVPRNVQRIRGAGGQDDFAW